MAGGIPGSSDGSQNNEQRIIKDQVMLEANIQDCPSRMNGKAMLGAEDILCVQYVLN